MARLFNGYFNYLHLALQHPFVSSLVFLSVCINAQRHSHVQTSTKRKRVIHLRQKPLPCSFTARLPPSRKRRQDSKDSKKAGASGWAVNKWRGGVRKSATNLASEPDLTSREGLPGNRRRDPFR
jgi:hypothetical protein